MLFNEHEVDTDQKQDNTDCKQYSLSHCFPPLFPTNTHIKRRLPDPRKKESGNQISLYPSSFLSVVRCIWERCFGERGTSGRPGNLSDKIGTGTTPPSPVRRIRTGLIVILFYITSKVKPFLPDRCKILPWPIEKVKATNPSKNGLWKGKCTDRGFNELESLLPEASDAIIRSGNKELQQPLGHADPEPGCGFWKRNIIRPLVSEDEVWFRRCLAPFS